MGHCWLESRVIMGLALKDGPRVGAGTPSGNLKQTPNQVVEMVSMPWEMPSMGDQPSVCR